VRSRTHTPFLSHTNYHSIILINYIKYLAISELRKFRRVISGNRRPFKDYTPELRGFIISAKAAGASQAAIASAVSLPRQRISNQIKRFQDHHTARSLPRSSKPKAFGPRGKRRIVRFVRKRPRSTYQHLRSYTGTNVHNATFQRVLRRYYLRKWKVVRGIELDENRARVRLDFAQKYRDPAALYSLIRTLFSDEYTVQTNPDNPSQ
jgi:hypothetical protein